MGTPFSAMLRNLFGLTLVLNMMWCAALCKLVSVMTFISPRSRNGYSVLLVQLAWRISLFFSPWVSVDKTSKTGQAAAKMVEQMKQIQADHASGKMTSPIFVLGNHTSFLDTILTASKLPAVVMFYARTYMGAHLLKLPLLSTIVRACGHFPVYFTSGEDGKFSVDREKMGQVDKLVDNHIDAGGLLCFFPEGQMNGNPDTLMPFRYGGMKKALEIDAKLWYFVTHGNDKVWPRKAQVGGFPGGVQYSIDSIAPEGCQALVSQLKAKDPKLKNVADYEVLAKHCGVVMQAEYDVMKKNSESDKTK